MNARNLEAFGAALDRISAPIDRMRENVSRLSGLAQTEADRMSFMDGHRAYVEFGENFRRGGGAVWFEDGSWVAKIYRADKEPLSHCDPDETEFKTFREALDCYMEEYARLMA